MYKLISFIKRKKMIIIIAIIVLICSIAISVGVYTQVTNEGPKDKEQEQEIVNYEDLKNNFQGIFTNSINIEETAALNISYEELLYTRFNVKEEENGKYSIDAKIPWFKGDSETLKK